MITKICVQFSQMERASQLDIHVYFGVIMLYNIELSLLVHEKNFSI